MSERWNSGNNEERSQAMDTSGSRGAWDEYWAGQLEELVEYEVRPPNNSRLNETESSVLDDASKREEEK